MRHPSRGNTPFDFDRMNKNNKIYMTVESLQSGLFYGHLGSMREIVNRISAECFKGEKPFVIGTGGFSSLFEKEKIFDVIIPDLVLKGNLIALSMNHGADQ